MLNVLCSPVVTNCTFLENHAQSALGPYGLPYGGEGGAMVNARSGAVVSECAFTANSAQLNGGAVLNGTDSAGPLPLFANCLFSDNHAGAWGSAFMSYPPFPGYLPGITVTNCTFTGNDGASATIDSAYSTLTNCIAWGNTDDTFSRYGTERTGVLYSDVQGGFEGEGNIDLDPLFTDPLNGDYTLQDGSPCLDTGTMAGAPATDLMGIARPQGPGIDMGAYEKPVGEGEGEGEGQVPVCGPPGLAVLAVALSVCLVAVLWTRPSPARQSW